MGSAEHYQSIYNNHADLYHQLISREDYQGNLLPAIESIYPLSGASVVEFGAGTGRLTRLLASRVKTIAAFDGSSAMLAEARTFLKDASTNNWTLEVASNHALPVSTGSADLAVAGWTFGHLTQWYPTGWQTELDKVLDEVSRILKPDGTAIIIETLGTGSEFPTPPSPVLAEYYTILENKYAFRKSAIRTDYQFKNIEEAIALARFFFGEALANKIASNSSSVLPECTGLWYGNPRRTQIT